MALFKTKQGALFIAPETTFGAGVAEEDLQYLEVSEVNFGTLGNEYRDADVLTQQDTDDDGMIARVPGERGFTFPMCAVQSTIPNDELAPPSDLPPQVALLKGILGEPVLGGYGVAASGTTTSAVLGTGDGASFKPGQLVWVRKSTGRVMMSRVKSISTDTLTMSPALPAAVAVGDKVIGGYSLAKGAGGALNTFELCYKGAAPTDVRRSLGCQISQATITAEPRGYPKLDVTMKTALNLDPDDCIALGYAGNPAAQEWTYPKISQVIDGGLYIYSGTSLIKLDGSLSVDFGIELQANDGFSYDDPNGVREWVQTSSKVRVKVNPAYRNNDLLAAFKTPNAVFQLIGWWGTGVGVFGFCIPAAVLVTPPNLVDRDGYLAQELEFGAKAYAGDTDSVPSSAAANKPFVCGFLAGTTTP